ncbi:hypothetical protein [Mycolicibacterium litorale]|uniref:Uncharacterized protein n=1 Tax=Mycolicibacterium litorale TaxID=758802 RepID=A0AAD1MTY7_9MYCO|nr:hypothetical protein [Mycolicibacterium litorale]MCV7418813.1 hypothetical protein [Mycolicibacterium litorale]TDY00405.1 hypothetical protein BCL50_5262 [Mycolicibacterium litorale]BBY15762.1 hypothetical protein MLIT_13540 [Mycolicibacterium litorale]
MTQPADTTPTAEQPQPDPSPEPGTPDPTLETPEPEQPEPEQESPNSEAARWRVRLRETEAERDALAERVAGYQRRECEAVVADVLEVPGDLWELGHAELSEFYTDDGDVDENAVRAAAAALVESRPGLAKGATLPSRHATWGQYSSAVPGESPGWAAVIR